MDTLYKRLGELKQRDPAGRLATLTSATKAPAYIPAPAPKWLAWIRGGGADLSYEVDKGWDFDQTTYGLQGGADYTFDYNASRISFGAFGGYGWSKADVHDTFFYGNDKSNLDINGWNAGIYATFRQVGGLPGTGWYVDLVGKVDVLDVDMNGDGMATATTSRPAPTPPHGVVRVKSATASTSAMASSSSRRAS